MRYFIICFTFIFCLVTNTTAAVFQEEVKYYDIEILLFENLKVNPNNMETWPTSIEFNVPENSLFIGSPYPGPIPAQYNPRFTFKAIKASTYQLQEEAKSLNEHEDYRIIYHRSWRQPGMKKDEALNVQIERNIVRLPYSSVINSAVVNSLGADATNDTNIDSGDDAVYFDKIINKRLPKMNQLKGLINITLSRYLHIKTDIQYTQHIVVKDQDQTDPSFAEIKPQVYQLKQTRKMRSKELHYIDNPKLGLLVYITPVKIKAKAKAKVKTKK